MKYISLLALTLILSISPAFCQTTDRSADDTISSALRELVVSSSEDLESYTFSLEMEQKMNIQNLSTDQSQQILTRSIGMGLANMTDRTLKIIMASLSYIPGDETNSTAIALEEYLQNDTIYVRIDGNWTAMQLPGIEDAWSQQNALEQQIDLFNQSRLTLVGSEVIDGDECYRVRADIDISSYADHLSGELAMPVPSLSLNSSDLFRNTTLEVDYWISKNSHLLRRADVSETLNMTPQSLGFAGEEDRDLAINIQSNISMIFSGFNEPLRILIPPEASRAPPLSVETDPGSEAPLVSSGEDLAQSLENETIADEAASNREEARGEMIEAVSSNETADARLVPDGTTANSAVPGGALPALLRD